MQTALRRDDIELAPELREGAMGEIETEARNAISLRVNAHEGELSAPLRTVSIDELKAALVRGASRVFDVFRTFDRNGDGQVSKQEFRAALPLLGFDNSNAATLDSIFDTIDADSSGQLALDELQAALRRDDVEIAPELRDGAMGEIEVDARNAISLRSSALV